MGVVARLRREAGRAKRAATARLPLRPGLLMRGHLLSEIGVGQAARLYARAAEAAGIPLSYANFHTPGRENEPELAEACRTRRSWRKAELAVTGIEVALPANRRAVNLCCAFWELARVPEGPAAAVRLYDEVWAPSRFVAAAFEAMDGPPVRWMPQPLVLPEAPPPPRPGDGALRIFTFFDTDSWVARKNPQAAAAAFRAAFPSGREDARLAVKLRGTRSPELRDWLAREAAADPRIEVVDRTLPRAELEAMMAGCDVFLSLHRSEGFGFGPAEALAAGKAVVATDYGGTTDFVTSRTGWPVPFRLIPVGPQDYVHPEGQEWADPEVEAAAQALREIHDDPRAARARAEAGFALLGAQHSLQATGARMRARLEELGAL